MDTVTTVWTFLSILAAITNLADWLLRHRGWPLEIPSGWIGVLFYSWVGMELVDGLVTLPWLDRVSDTITLLFMMPLLSVYSIAQRHRSDALKLGASLTAQQGTVADDRPQAGHRG